MTPSGIGMNKNLTGSAAHAPMGLLTACGTQSQAPNALSQADAQALSEAAQGDLQLIGALLGDTRTGALKAQSSLDSLDVGAQAWGLPRYINLILRAVSVLYLPRWAVETAPSAPPPPRW